MLKYDSSRLLNIIYLKVTLFYTNPCNLFEIIYSKILLANELA